MMKKYLILFLFTIFVVAVHAAENVVQPSFLKKGDKVALISPSYYIEPTVVSQAADVLKKWGLVPVIGNNMGAGKGRRPSVGVTRRRGEGCYMQQGGIWSYPSHRLCPAQRVC